MTSTKEPESKKTLPSGEAMDGLKTADDVVAFLGRVREQGVTQLEFRGGGLEIVATIEARDEVAERVRAVIGTHPDAVAELEEVLSARQEERIKFHSSDD